MDLPSHQLTMTVLMTPDMANFSGNVHGGTIRPKRTIRSGERPLHALRERGVEYIEVRCMDLDPFEPVGIAAGTMRFLDLFLLHCWLTDSPNDTPDELGALARNQHRTASAGREPGLKLERRGGEVLLRDWGRELLTEFAPIAAKVDAALERKKLRQELQKRHDELRSSSLPG